MEDYFPPCCILKPLSDHLIHKLSDDDHFWRVDWHGQVGYPADIKNPSQPHIEIQFSKLSGDSTNLHSAFDLASNQWPATQTIKLPVGMLHMLKIGDIWHRHKHFCSPAYELITFEDLNITNETTTVIKAGLSKEGQAGCESFYLPLAHHPFHSKHTKSYCVLVEHQDVCAIIPAIELIRFYFGSSSQLLARLFDGPFKSENFWQQVDNQIVDRPTIHLAQGIQGQSAADIGRLALSSRARAAGTLISSSCMAAKANGHPIYPKMMFPFIGRTNLVASGQWLPFEGREKGVFLAFKIMSCSHPFPFRTLQYTSDNRTSANTRAGSTKKDDGKVANEKRYSRAMENGEGLTREEANKRKSPRLVQAATSQTAAFPDLSSKQIAKIDPECVPRVIVSHAGRTLVSESSVGDSGTDMAVCPIDIVVSDANAVESARPKRPVAVFVAVFLDLASKLAKLPRVHSVDIVPLHPRQRRDYLSPMPRIIDEDGVIHPSCMVERANGKSNSSRPRKISVARIRDVGTTHYVLMPEPATPSHSTVDMHLISDKANVIQTTADIREVISLQFSGTFEENQRQSITEHVSSTWRSVPAPDASGEIDSTATQFLVLFQSLRRPCKDTSESQRPPGNTSTRI